MKTVLGNKLHAFLTAFHAKLQQEIRDGCYAHLFDEDTIASLLHYGAPSLHSLNGNNEISRASLSRGPRFLEEAIVPSCISRETVKTFFSTFNGLSVLTDDPRNFTYLLNDDIFSCGVTAGDMRIQALHLRYSLDKLDKNLPFMTEHELLATSLAPFPSPTFKAANEFRLTITLIRNYGSMQGQSSLIISDIASYTKPLSSLFANFAKPVQLLFVFDCPTDPRRSVPPVNLTEYIDDFDIVELRRKSERYVWLAENYLGPARLVQVLRIDRAYEQRTGVLPPGTLVDNPIKDQLLRFADRARGTLEAAFGGASQT